ncbi:MAG: hypothetical protein ACEPO8_06320, partial [Rhodothermaceae bacterium]
MKKNFLKSGYLVLVLLCICFTFCSDSVTPKEEEPGRRDYVWEVDTLEFERNKSFTRYCVIDNNLWLCGAGGGLDNVWHYKNENWIHNLWMFGARPIAIFGTNENSVWVFTIEGYIFRHRNGEFIKTGKIEISEYKEVVIQRVWGKTATDLYATGYGVYKESQGEIGRA